MIAFSVMSSSELFKNWHPSKNGCTDPKSTSLDVLEHYWWQCKKGHEWQATIASVMWGNDCPKCRTRPATASNNLKTCHQDIAKEWHPFKNRPHFPLNILPKARLKVWWLCEHGHQYRAQVSSRTSTMKSGCPYCAGQRATLTNNLKVKFPDIAADWDLEANHPLRPEDVLPETHKKVHWVCSKHGSYPANIGDRTRHNSGCPYCSGRLVSDDNRLSILYPKIAEEWHPTKNGKLLPSDTSFGSGQKAYWLCKNNHTYPAAIASRTINSTGCPFCSRQTSKPELRMLAELSWVFENTQSRFRVGRYELDVAIPLFQIGVEYDGYYFHKNRQTKDKQKLMAVRERGWQVFRLRESGLLCSEKSDMQVPKDKELQKNALDRLMLRLRENVDEKHQVSIDEYVKKTSFQNNELYKRYLSYYPNPLPENSLATKRPDIAGQWHHEMNFPLTPENFSVGSNHIALWICDKKGCVYPASIKSRTKDYRPVNCSICAGKHVSSENSLQQNSPTIAAEWHPKRNGTLTPGDVTNKSKRLIWWRCANGHEWQQTISERTSRNIPCQTCKREAKSLHFLFPRIAEEWHPELNGDKLPEDYTYGSNEIVWWRCANGHEWQDPI